MEKIYVDTVRLLLETAPEVFRAPCFALKGGTALNLFVQDMPRLSVDIDVVFTDHAKGRSEALAQISTALTETCRQLVERGLEAELIGTQGGDETKIIVRRARAIVKVEVNHVFRGTLLPVETRGLVNTARTTFTTEIHVPVLAVAELYGSKIVAAMDRQHPRDLYDVRAMYEKSGLADAIVECFVCYLAGHNRPIHEVLFSRDSDIRMAFENEFQGMTRETLSVDELIAARTRLRADLATMMTEDQKQFLLSLASAEPEWTRMSIPHLSELPALRWKLQNLMALKKSNPRKFRQQHDELQSRFRR